MPRAAAPALRARRPRGRQQHRRRQAGEGPAERGADVDDAARRREVAARRRGRAAGWRACLNDDAGVTFAARPRSRRGLRARPPGRPRAARKDGGPRTRSRSSWAAPPRRSATELAVPSVVRTRPSVARTAVQGRSATVYLAGRPVGGAGGHHRRAGKGGCSDCRGRRRPGRPAPVPPRHAGAGARWRPRSCCAVLPTHEPARGPGRRRASCCATATWRSCTGPSTTTGRCPRASSSRARRWEAAALREVREETGLRCRLLGRGARRPLHRQPRAAQARAVLADGRRGGRVHPQRRGRRAALAGPGRGGAQR